MSPPVLTAALFMQSYQVSILARAHTRVRVGWFEISTVFLLVLCFIFPIGCQKLSGCKVLRYNDLWIIWWADFNRLLVCLCYNAPTFNVLFWEIGDRDEITCQEQLGGLLRARVGWFTTPIVFLLVLALSFLFGMVVHSWSVSPANDLIAVLICSGRSGQVSIIALTSGCFCSILSKQVSKTGFWFSVSALFSTPCRFSSRGSNPLGAMCALQWGNG